MHLINFKQYRKVQNENSPLLKGNHHQQFFVYFSGQIMHIAAYICVAFKNHLYYTKGSYCVYTVL